MMAGFVADCLTGLALIVAGLAWGHMLWPWALLTVCAGLVIFSFIEYAAHRWLFHGRKGPFVRGHARHHRNPTGYDALPFFLPPLFMLALAALFALALAPGYDLLLVGAVAAGYAVYGISHYVMHVHRFKSALLQRWVAFHDMHHRRPRTNFGVTTALWDVILGTRYREAASGAVTDRH